MIIPKAKLFKRRIQIKDNKNKKDNLYKKDKKDKIKEIALLLSKNACSKYTHFYEI